MPLASARMWPPTGNQTSDEAGNSANARAPAEGSSVAGLGASTSAHGRNHGGRANRSGGLARRAHRDPGRRDGHGGPGSAAHRGAVPRRALRRTRQGPSWRHRHPQPHATRGRRRRPPGLPRCGCRHRLDQHVHRDARLAGRLRTGRAGPGGQPHRRRDRAACGGRGRCGDGHAPMGGGLRRANQSDALDLAARERPGLPGDLLRRDPRGVRHRRAGPGRRRR